MGRRDELISKSILKAIFNDERDDNRTVLSRIFAFFSLFQVALSRYDAALFHHLRSDVWGLDENDYRDSFKIGDDKIKLKSTFFSTKNFKFLVKSVPRPSEYEFFKKELLPRYADHMASNPESLLVRITDFLHTRYLALGSILSFAPSHHIIMENILFGQDGDALRTEWETYDLKPIDYFYPERDIAGGMLASEATIHRLVDIFEDRIRVTEAQRMHLINTLNTDTQLLESANVTDYSLFLVRYPASPENRHADVEVLASRATPWRKGVVSTDGKWVYRAIILDFFWAKHKTQARLMTALINSFNFFARKGPMSITTEAKEYRQRFVEMVESIVEAAPLRRQDSGT